LLENGHRSKSGESSSVRVCGKFVTRGGTETGGTFSIHKEQIDSDNHFSGWREGQFIERTPKKTKAEWGGFLA